VKRKMPVRHPVRAYEKDDGTKVSSHWRGSGVPPTATPSPRSRKVVPYVIIEGRRVEIHDKLEPREKEMLDIYLAYLRASAQPETVSTWNELEAIGSKMANFVYMYDKDRYPEIDGAYKDFQSKTAHENFLGACVALAEVAQALAEINEKKWVVE
jgi:hypothetical protein